MSKFTTNDAIKEIRSVAKENGLTFKKKNMRINNSSAYQFVERGGSKVVLDNQSLWIAYENIQNGYIEKITGNAPAIPIIISVEEYEICGDRCWIVKNDGRKVGNSYLDANELKNAIGVKRAELVVQAEAQDWIF